MSLTMHPWGLYCRGFHFSGSFPTFLPMTRMHLWVSSIQTSPWKITTCLTQWVHRRKEPFVSLRINLRNRFNCVVPQVIYFQGQPYCTSRRLSAALSHGEVVGRWWWEQWFWNSRGMFPPWRNKVQLIFINAYGNWVLVGTDQWPDGFLPCTAKCLAETWVFWCLHDCEYRSCSVLYSRIIAVWFSLSKVYKSSLQSGTIIASMIK